MCKPILDITWLRKYISDHHHDPSIRVDIRDWDKFFTPEEIFQFFREGLQTKFHFDIPESLAFSLIDYNAIVLNNNGVGLYGSRGRGSEKTHKKLSDFYKIPDRGILLRTKIVSFEEVKEEL